MKKPLMELRHEMEELKASVVWDNDTNPLIDLKTLEKWIDLIKRVEANGNVTPL